MALSETGDSEPNPKRRRVSTESAHSEGENSSDSEVDRLSHSYNEDGDDHHNDNSDDNDNDNENYDGENDGENDDDDNGDDDNGDDDSDDDELHGQKPLAKSSKKRTISTVLSRNKLSKSRAAVEKTGVVYLSRIPPRMSPTKLRQLLSRFESPVLRIFLSPESMAVYTRRIKSGGSKKRQFTEGWVEFEDKKVAKKVAEQLNAQQIGGKKGGFWYDDLWNIKYLSKFKWHHLTEQIGGLQLLCG
jgi:ESF2/ABP1 family protein